ncbi:hypothetical protein CKO51_14760 [Rhodopirellula sp. SM50]|nr:hypothetical protein [Rhodopirellula sp. SM50]PAY18824.1 hypothetical protein CKO51_14760 [Rhodopirellula sp. SM50]
MSSEPQASRRHWSHGFWWAALALLAFGLPQCSLLVIKAITWIPLGNSLINATDIAISYAIYGVATAVSFASGLVILAAILLRAGSGWKRLLMAVGFVAVHCLVTGLVLAVTQFRWMQHAMQEESAYRRVIAYLFLSPAMSFASVFPAAVMQWFRRWTITRGWPESNLQRVNVLALMEWVLVSALIFTLVRLSFVADYQSNVYAFYYEALMVMLPAIGLGIVTMLLFRWILCVDASPRRFLILLIIALIHGFVFAASFVALQAEENAIGPNLNLQYSIAPLSTCATGTLIATAIVGCLRKLGYRLHTSGTR